MTAQIIKFPSEVAADRWAAARQLDAPCQILILPVVRVEHEDSIRARRRRAYFAMKEALRVPQTIPLMTPLTMDDWTIGRSEMAKRFGIKPEHVHIGWDLGEASFDRVIKTMEVWEPIYGMDGAVIGRHRRWVPID